MADEGEIKCESGKLFSSCQVSVKKGESKPIISPAAGDVEGPCSKPIIFEVPYTGIEEMGTWRPLSQGVLGAGLRQYLLFS
jgi:hypothetical protein